MVFFANNAEQGLTLQKCAVYPTKQVEATPFAFIVVVLTTSQVGVTTNLTIIEKNQIQCLGTSGNVDQIIATTGGYQPQVSHHHQTRFDEGLNRQYSPNYINYHQSPLGSIPGQDLSAILMELANIQSRSLEMMDASQRSQQEAFHKLTRASKDKVNDAMFASINVFDGRNRQAFEDWIDKIDQACRVSDQDFRTEIFKKSTGTM